MKLSEMWVKRETDTWLHRLNKDGNESGMRDARRYYSSKQDAISHHNHMVDANPGKEIAHNLHMKTDFGHFKMKLVGKQTARAVQTPDKTVAMDKFLQLLDSKGSAASAWMPDAQLEELLKLHNSGADIKVFKNALPEDKDADDWFNAKVSMMEPKGYKLFGKKNTRGMLDMIFVRT